MVALSYAYAEATRIKRCKAGSTVHVRIFLRGTIDPAYLGHALKHSDHSGPSRR
jgi:hypothetical protein